MKTITKTEEFCEYEIQGSLFLAMGSMEKEVTDIILELMDLHADNLPVKDNDIQMVAFVIDIGGPSYYSLAYINTDTSVLLFLSIDKINVDECLDHRIANQVFTQNF